MSAGGAPGRGAFAMWVGELALGMRLSVAGGRSGWARLVMISLGVGLGVAMLLVAASVPTAVAGRDARLAAREVVWGQSMPSGGDTLLIARADTQYRGREIYGRLVQPEGERAPLPPGVTRRPAPGEMVASPALARLLAGDEGALLRGRWGARVVGAIGEEGLAGPGEYAFYLGTDRLDESAATRVRSFGRPDLDEGVPPVLLLLGVVAMVVLLLPVAIFVATAVRFGGEARDRRLAALRLVGADAAMTRRIAAGETLAGALLGLGVGGLLCVAVRLLADRVSGMTFSPADFLPVPALAVLVVALVPVAAVLVTLSALRRVVVEPLGVVRLSGDRRRRLWWRLILPVAGLALLYPLHDGLSEQAQGFEFQVMAGVAALLAGVALLLPWVVEAVVRRLGGGGVAWQLAVRRLQLDSGSAVRAVSGIAVSVAGVIALQGLFVAVQAQVTVENQRDTGQFQAKVFNTSSIGGSGADRATELRRWKTALRRAPGVRATEPVASVEAVPTGSAAAPDALTNLRVGDCAALRQEARLDACTDGDTFVVASPAAPPRPGTTYTLGEATEKAAGPRPRWTLPAKARTVQPHAGSFQPTDATILVTPAALRGTQPTPSGVTYYVALDPADPDALDRLRNAAARVDPAAHVQLIELRTLDGTLLTIRQALLAGATALLLLIGASLLVNVAEQLRERRRLLAVLVAFGVRRNTLSGSVLCQIAIPVMLGLTLAVLTGTGLSTILQAAAKAPIRFDWLGISATTGAAALVVLLTTAASLPLLWRLTKPGGLRSE
ncbi:ABC transporter permease [Nonomuraea lactucae]|uniref:ABC transporter permease n=1 Tax=Nonomuraea lactucae TaxID=2249762 RepID=UPI0013B3E795|nr:ABC transporter permease [Nonomuraea lactucae]